MEYLNKSEVMTYLNGLRTELTIQGKDGTTVTTIMHALNSMYSFRPLLQSHWVRKSNKEIITCSTCGFQTLAYKNSKYCPDCGRQMINGKTQKDRINDKR